MKRRRNQKAASGRSHIPPAPPLAWAEELGQIHKRQGHHHHCVYQIHQHPLKWSSNWHHWWRYIIRLQSKADSWCHLQDDTLNCWQAMSKAEPCEQSATSCWFCSGASWRDAVFLLPTKHFIWSHTLCAHTLAEASHCPGRYSTIACPAHDGL